MPISLDSSLSGVVVHCSDCQYWSELAADRAEGILVAHKHERSVHPESQAAAANLSQWRSRHARTRTNY